MSYVFLSLGIIFLVLFLIFRNKFGSIKAILFKTLTSLMFIICALSSMLINNIINITSVLIVIGLICGMIGDILLDFKVYFKSLNINYNVPIKDHDLLMYSGMASFGVGHILFIIGVYLNSNNLYLNLIYSLLIGLVLISLILLISIKLMKMNFRQFFIPSYIYGFLLSSFVIFMIFILINNNSLTNILLLIGSILFILSDLVLSMTYFSKDEDYKKEGILNPESRFMISLNHILYYGAQFLIALSILFI